MVVSEKRIREIRQRVLKRRYHRLLYITSSFNKKVNVSVPNSPFVLNTKVRVAACKFTEVKSVYCIHVGVHIPGRVAPHDTTVLLLLPGARVERDEE